MCWIKEGIDMTKKVKEIVDMLEENGWNLVRINGDHRIFKKAGARRPIVLPGNLNDDLAVGTLKSTLREMGL